MLKSGSTIMCPTTKEVLFLSLFFYAFTHSSYLSFPALSSPISLSPSSLLYILSLSGSFPLLIFFFLCVWSGTYMSYRTDCSGYVSYCWQAYVYKFLKFKPTISKFFFCLKILKIFQHSKLQNFEIQSYKIIYAKSLGQTKKLEPG